MTAPALPGAAPDPAPGRNDPARLPPEVERLLQAALLDAYNHGWAVGAKVTAPVGPDTEAALRTAILAAMRAATAGSGAASPAAGASARALGGDGEPVAWRVVGTTAAARAIGSLMDAWDLSDEDSVVEKLRGPMKALRKLIDADALYTRPAATGDTTDDAVRAAHREEVDALRDKLTRVLGAIQRLQPNGSPIPGDEAVVAEWIVGEAVSARAAHRAEVERAVAEERSRNLDVLADFYSKTRAGYYASLSKESRQARLDVLTRAYSRMGGGMIHERADELDRVDPIDGIEG